MMPGMMPPDPAMAGGMPPGPPGQPVDPAMVQQILANKPLVDALMQEIVKQAQMQGGAPQGAPGGMPPQMPM